MISFETIKIFYEFLLGAGMKEAIDKHILIIMVTLIQVLIQNKILSRTNNLSIHTYTGTHPRVVILNVAARSGKT